MKICIILGSLLLAEWAGALPSIDGDEFCTGKEDGYHCASCLQPVYCNSSLTTPATVLPSCANRNVCEEFSPTLAGCTPEDPSNKCACSSSINLCDPYSDYYLAICISDTIDDVQDCGSSDKECHFRQCMDPADCPILPNETCVHDDHFCNLGYFCVNGNAAEDYWCSEEFYLDEECNCLLPPEPCADFCSGDCADATDCHQYYVCDGNGTVLSGPILCPDDSDYYYFNPESNPPKCDETSSGCSSLYRCGFNVGQ